MNRFSRLFVLVLVLLVLALQPAHVLAAIVFTKVADTTTAIPDGSGVFTSLANPSIDNGRVVFVGNGAGGQTGIYEYFDGQLTMRVNQSTLMPGGTGGFTKFYMPALDGADIAFKAEGAAKQAGVYAQFEASLERIADSNMQIPGSTTKFSFASNTVFSAFDVGDVAIDDRQVEFRNGNGVFLGSSSGLRTIASFSNSTPIPDQPYNFNFFAFDFSPAFHDGQILFGGRFGEFFEDFFTNGLYRWTDSGGIETIFDQRTILPGATSAAGPFLTIPIFDNGVPYVNVIRTPGFSIVNLSLGTLQWDGLFRIDPTGLVPVISPADVGASPFQFFAMDNGRIGFPRGDDTYWIYGNGDQMRVVAPGDIILGKTVVGLTYVSNKSREIFEGNRIVLALDFNDGTSGIYIASIPEPSTFVLMLVAIIGLTIAIRRRASARLCKSA